MDSGSPRNDGDAHQSPSLCDERLEQVSTALRDVLDPELDQSVVELGFISSVSVTGAHVTVAFHLPTFWCSANFAWIMAEDMRLVLRALPWVGRADIRLIDHFAADKINAGTAEGQSFRETFGEEAGGDLGELRATFRRKAFLGRMAAVIEALYGLNRHDEWIVTVPIGTLAMPHGPLWPRTLVSRFLELRAFFGGPCRPDDAAFRTAEGDPIPAPSLPAYLRDIRMTRRGVEANGEMCRILLAERYAASQPNERRCAATGS